MNSMERIISKTGDGSHTVVIEGTNISFHSRHGAMQESMHVFIGAGLHHIAQTTNTIRIFEMGFGTGLNALLTLREAQAGGLQITYTAIEAHPLGPEIISALNYAEMLAWPQASTLLDGLHRSDWETLQEITPGFYLHKIQGRLETALVQGPFDLIYYDAFAPGAQPELWTEDIFAKMYALLSQGGCLLTYCSKGDVRRAMQAAGFTVTKLPGPPGKREMVRAQKIQ